jgi:hypothetical protein
MSGGVSVETASSPPSPADRDVSLAYAGGSSFMARLQALSDGKAEYDAAKTRHDEALAELKLGTAVKNAFAHAERKQADATALFEQADAVKKLAQADADGLVKSAQAQADAIVAEAQNIHDAATAVKADADADRAAANAEREQLQAEREAAARLGEQAVRKEAAFQKKIDTLHAYLDAARADLAEILATAPAAVAAVQLAS